MSLPEPVKFLIVDDLPENIRALEALLKRDDLELHTARSGREALELLLRNDYALALLDVQMPEMDGFELAELMRGTERTRHVPIIFITAIASDEGRRFRGYEAGAVDFIFKPVDPIVMRSKAQVFFDIGRQQRELNRQRNELQQTSRELGDALRRLHAHSDNSPLAIVEFDPDLRIVSWSKGAERLFGWTARDMVGRRIEESGWLAPDMAPILSGTLTEVMAVGEQRRKVDCVRATHRDGGVLDCEWYGSVLRNTSGQPISINVQILDVTERRRAEETQRLLIGELNHRVKNTLASVQAIAAQTLRHTGSPESFSETFAGRIQALARAHNMLSDATWHGARLEQLIIDQLRLGTVDEGRISISGPDVAPAAGPAVRLALIFHELCTNANKYGALCSPEGRITLTWTLDGERLAIRWQETGSQGILAPTRKGFGTTLIQQSLRADNGSAEASYADDGVTWEFSLELAPAEGTQLERRIASASAAAGDPAGPHRALRRPARADHRGRAADRARAGHHARGCRRRRRRAGDLGRGCLAGTQGRPFRRRLSRWQSARPYRRTDRLAFDQGGDPLRLRFGLWPRQPAPVLYPCAHRRQAVFPRAGAQRRPAALRQKVRYAAGPHPAGLACSCPPNHR